MSDNDTENKTDNNEDELCIIYKKNTLSSHYLGKLLEGPGTHMRKSIVNRDLVISSLGEYNILYSLDTNIDRIVKLLSREICNENDEPKPLQNIEMKERAILLRFS